MKMVMGRNLWAKAVWGWRQYNLPWIVRPILRYRRYMLEIFLAAGVFQALGVVLPLVTQVIIDKVIVNHGMVTLNVLCGGLLFVLLFQLLMDCSRRILFAHTAGKVELILGAQFMHHLIQLPLSFFTQRRIGNVLMKDGEAQTSEMEISTLSGNNAILNFYDDNNNSWDVSLDISGDTKRLKMMDNTYISN